jgi:hypothetical protein
MIQHCISRTVVICTKVYENRLKTLGLPTLEYRRDRYDMIKVYKALHDIDDIKWQNMFILSANQTRGHHLKLVKKRCNTTQRLNTLFMRIVDHWNNLSEDTGGDLINMNQCQIELQMFLDTDIPSVVH